jgi:hypothetical protein
MSAMTTQAWIFMGSVMGMIALVTFYCFFKLLTSQRRLGGDE